MSQVVVERPAPVGLGGHSLHPPRTRSSQDKRRRVLILVMLGIPTAYMLFFLGVPTGRAVYTS
ncbi:MAG: hypothetical protein M0005_06590, partial [Actinomycetota bacterium]|nr:hypothetical protein [Actinomycetota bacterium]